jgi:hypothetical protein
MSNRPAWMVSLIVSFVLGCILGYQMAPQQPAYNPPGEIHVIEAPEPPAPPGPPEDAGSTK